MIPAESRPSRVFAQLFLDGTPAEMQQQLRKLREGQSIMDTVQDEVKLLTRRAGAADREKLDEYFSSVRELEERLAASEAWAHKPKPKLDMPPPRDITDGNDLIGRMKLLFDLVPLVLQTDSTRVMTIFLQGANSVPPVKGVTIDHHNLSHHGKDPAKIAQLRLIEEAQLEVVRDLLAKLKTKQEAGTSLLDRTMVLFGSNLGNANSHDTRNLADPARRRRIQARPARGVRREQQHPALQPVRHDARTTRSRNRQVRVEHRHADGPGSRFGDFVPMTV